MPPSSCLVATDSAGKQLNKDQVKEYLDEFRILILADLRISQRKDDAYLLRYLHCTGFKIDEAFKRLKMMFELQTEYPDWFASSHPSNYSILMSWNTKAILAGRDRCGRRIYYTKMANIDANKTTMQELARFDDMWLEAVLDEPETQTNGMCCVIDLAGFSWKMFRWLTPTNVRVASRHMELVPTKKLVIHVVKSSMLLNAAVALVFPFLSNRTKEHIHFHYEDWPSLHRYVDPENLSEEYGGKLDDLDFEERNKWLVDQAPRLMENFKNDHRF